MIKCSIVSGNMDSVSPFCLGLSSSLLPPGKGSSSRSLSLLLTFAWIFSGKPSRNPWASSSINTSKFTISSPRIYPSFRFGPCPRTTGASSPFRSSPRAGHCKFLLVFLNWTGLPKRLSIQGFGLLLLHVLCLYFHAWGSCKCCKCIISLIGHKVLESKNQQRQVVQGFSNPNFLSLLNKSFLSHRGQPRQRPSAPSRH